MREIIRMILTERDNVTYCAARALMASAGIEIMIRFWTTGNQDWQSFGTAIAALGVAIAAKNYSEK